jgi:lipopolysaccharide/colanic/teichoic acid biosynthesis glycosyltransferase
MKNIQFFVKRVLDIVFSIFAIFIFLPVFVIVAMIVKFTSDGPIFFKQTRVGMHDREFSILKFRTMKVDSHLQKNGLAVHSNDQRITKLGRLLRKTSLDELPQFFNVLRGDISFVGPRPGLPVQLKYFSKKQRMRTIVRPGITGLATINGRASIPWSKRIEYDLEYINKFSLLLDFKILFKTIYVVLASKGVYYDHSKGPAFDLADPDDLPQATNKRSINDNS